MTSTASLTQNPPPIPEHRKAVYEYYGLIFDSDGCPMKKTTAGAVVFHPILAAYLIVDYMTWFKSTKDATYFKFALHIAELALAKAQVLGDALVFWYLPEDKLSYVPGVFYSALTQAWYLKALCTLRPYSKKRAGKDWNLELRGLFNSLLLGIENQGVLIKKDIGWIVEEYPHKLPLYVLNGWLTALRIVRDCEAEILETGINVKLFLDENIRAVEALLPLYDAAFCSNSRYQLTGYSRLRLVFDRPVSCRVEAFEMEIPGEGIFAGELEKKENRWTNYIERVEPRLLQFNIVRSLVSSPELNVFRSRLFVDKDCSLKVFLADGDYRPDLTGMPTERWNLLHTLTVSSSDTFEFELKLPFDGRDTFAYPTNFKKVIDGINYNAYHFVHIIDLAELYSYCGKPSFKHYALRWLDYVESWKDSPLLQDEIYSYAPHAYGEKFGDIVKGVLDRKERSKFIQEIPT